MRRLALIVLWALPGMAAEPSSVPAAGEPGTAASTPSPLGCPIPELPALDPRSTDPTDERVDVESGSVSYALDGSAEFTGRLKLRRGDDQIAADRATYDRQSGEFTISGQVEYRNPTTWIRGDGATYNAESRRFDMRGAEFDIFAVPARGSAGELAVDRLEVLTLKDVTYSTCSRGKDDWLLRAGSLEIDRRTGTGTARNARLEFMGVPILYAPYLTYPVTDQRKSGLLLPDFGRSDQRGVDVALPYYWNLAPNFDATLTTRYMSRRGLQGQGEFRFLTPMSSGTVRAEFTPNDNVADESRTLLSWSSQSMLPAGWRASIDARDVTDGRYFEDFSSGLAETSQTHLRRVLDLQYLGSVWSALVRFEGYQTLDDDLLPEERPYRRMPQISARANWPNGPLGTAYSLDTELAYFSRSAGVTGLRAHVMPEIAWPLQFKGVRFEPSIALDHTRYDLNDQDAGQDETPDRTVPIWTADLRTVLERSAGRGGRWLQTLEPRVQFVHVPFSDQSDFPLFDTIEPDFNLVQIFRRNRYAGLDRLSDTDQLSVGATTRLLRAQDGSQFLTASLGQTFYFSSRDVLLNPGDVASDNNSSDYIGELGLNFNQQWNVDLGYQYDTDLQATRLAEARVLYNPDDQRIFNLSYRFRRDSIREIDVAGAWPLGDRWSVVARYDYSLQDSEPLEQFLGLEYSTCCWGVRLVARRSLTTRDGEKDTNLTAQLVLKGFGSRGSAAERMLERGILGYDRFDRY